MRRSGNGRPVLALSGVLGSAALALGLFHARGFAHPEPVGVTWTGTIARVLDTNCVVCHGEGGMARPRLADYDSARLASQAIKRAVLTRHMPRWYAASGFGAFANDPSLTPHEIELLAQWADHRAPQGEAVPIAPGRTAAAAAEAPDLILTVPFSYRIAEAEHTFRLPTALTDVRAIRGWTFQPGHPSFITSAVISLTSGSTLGTWVPGERATFLPVGVTTRLPVGTAILLTVYYRQGAGPAADAGRVGLYFADRPGRELAHLLLPCGSTRLRQSIDALAIRPIVGSSAWSLAILARRRGGSLEPLGWFQDYPRDHAQTYWFRPAVRLPRGTAVDVGATHGTCGAELAYVPSGGPVLVPASPSSTLDAGVGRLGEKSPSSDGTGYWCPMHANVRAAMPGTCSQCGMALVPVTPDVEGKYNLDVEWLPQGGGAGTLRLVVRDPRTATIARRFESLHERPFHLFVIGDDLREFSHLHPVPQPDGSFELSPVSFGSGPYQLYADFLPVGGTPQLIRTTILPGPIAAGFSGSRMPHLARELGDKTNRGLRVRIEPDGGALIAGTPSLIAFHLEDAATGAPIADLQPYLGAWGHAFIVSADLADAVHSHPITPLTSPGGPTIFFQQRFPRAGLYRLWVQFQRGGSVATVSFTVDVCESGQTS
jgi:mono/diheme cytochrome c family protein